MNYRLKCEIVDENDEVVICDYVTITEITEIDEFGGNEAVDWTVARMLRMFKKTAREQHETKETA